MKSFFSSLDLTVLKHGYDDELVQFLTEVKGFIQNELRINYKKGSKYLPFWDKKAVEVSKILGVSVGTVCSARQTISNELYDKFGHDFFTVAIKKIGVARGRFNIIKSYNTLDNLFIPGVSVILDTVSPGSTVELEECFEEISFLQRYTFNRFEKDFESLDKNKLGYVLSVLYNKAGTSTDRFNIMRVLLK